MSKWTGKYDFCDYLEMQDAAHNFENFKSTTKLYIWAVNKSDWSKKEIQFTEYVDLIPYFTHIVSVSICNNGIKNVILSSKSWLEREEEKYWPTQHSLTLMHEFDEYVRENGRAPLWTIPLLVREQWKKCPLNQDFFCEYKKLKSGKRFCPYMYARKTSTGRICKLKRGWVNNDEI